VVDFREVAHLDYRGVRPLMARAEGFRRAGGDIKLSGLSPYLAAIFRAAGAHDRFEVYPHMNDARGAFALMRAPFV
jgi:anti-sigma B factor antagonist